MIPDLATILSLAIAASAVGVSWYGAVNARRASRQSVSNAKVAAEINGKLDGRLTALINSIHDALADWLEKHGNKEITCARHLKTSPH
jgi:hypothetical protein